MTLSGRKLDMKWYFRVLFWIGGLSDFGRLDVIPVSL